MSSPLLRRVVERVYLTYSGGTPLVHLSRGVISETDPDLIASMFNAIQAFMDDAFHAMHIGTVRSIELDDHHHVAFGKGHWLLLYVLYTGRESNRLERRVIRYVHEVEARFAPMLQNWNGDMAHVEPLKDALAKEWGVPEEHDLAPPSPVPAPDVVETL